MGRYRVIKQYAGVYYVIDDDDGGRVARVAKYLPGPMISVDGPRIVPPKLAKAIAGAMSRLARDLEREEAVV